MTKTHAYLPTQDEIREWCRYFQSTWTPEQELERASSSAPIPAVLREVRVSNLHTNDYLVEEQDK